MAFGLVSVLGLRWPLKYSPVLLLQLIYKLIWFAGLVLPLWLQGQFPTYGLVYAAIFATYVVGDLIAVPFGYVFSRDV